MTKKAQRIAVITGCASGIGAATAANMAALGITVIGVDLPTTQPHVSSNTSISKFIPADLSSQQGVAELAEKIDVEIDILVNNAGVAATLPWRQVIGINALAPRDLSRLLTPKFSDEPTVVTVASQAGYAWRTNYHRAQGILSQDNWDDAFNTLASDSAIQERCYEISKEAAIVNTMNLVSSGAKRRIRANSVSPGTVATPLLEDFSATMGESVIEGAAKWAGRHARPEEVASVITFLCSPQSSWVSGVDLGVDGGYSTEIMSRMMNKTAGPLS